MIWKNLPALLPLVYLVAALVVPLLGLWKKSTAYILALGASFAATTLSIYGFVYVILHGSISYQFGGWFPPVGIEYVYDPLSSFVSMVINVVAFLVILHSNLVVKNELGGRQMPYYSVVMLLLLGFNGIILTGDMFNLFVFIEISSLAGYGLIAVGDKKAPYAAFKYLIIGTIGASFFLLGVGFIYFVSGTLNMKDLAGMIPVLKQNQTVLVAMILMVVGIGIKMAIFPMHGWLPDAYTTAPSSSSALIAPIGTKVSAYVMIRLLFFVFGTDYFSRDLPVGELIAIFSCAGIILGSIMAMAQKNMKRMLAYSSVAQIGYIGLGIGLANPLGFIGAILHLLNHAFMKACLFITAGNIITKTGHSDITLFDDTYRKKYPWTMAAFTVAALSMVGLPPLAGFFSKWYLVLGTIHDGKWIYLGVILLSSLLNAVYFFRIIEKIYMKSPAASGETETDTVRDEVSPSMLLPTLILAAGLIVFGLLNVLIVTQITKMIPGSI
jgi:multicomponent Na+:H+ antiporter subunit D